MDKLEYAPIVVFAFNRLEPLKACIASLQVNNESKDSDLFVFVDGPRQHKEGEMEKVQNVRDFVKKINGFKSLTYRFTEKNMGLAKSIICGTSEIINHYGKVIVLEDDLIVAPTFLSYINMMLEAYKDNDHIMQISGYSAKIRNTHKYNCDYYLSGRAHSWSWATWENRWNTVDWDVKDYDEINSSRKMQKSFCKYGSDLFKMLKGWHDGKNSSWYIRFNYSMHKQGKYCIAPIKSLVINDGFKEGATHTAVYNRYKVSFNSDPNYQWNINPYLEWDEHLAKEAVRYWSVPYRIYGKIVTFLIPLSWNK